MAKEQKTAGQINGIQVALGQNFISVVGSGHHGGYSQYRAQLYAVVPDAKGGLKTSIVEVDRERSTRRAATKDAEKWASALGLQFIASAGGRKIQTA